jgi:hypothetical protein
LTGCGLAMLRVECVNEQKRDGSHAVTRKFFFFSEMGYNAYPLEALEQYGYSALLFPNSIFDAEKARDLWQMCNSRDLV